MKLYYSEGSCSMSCHIAAEEAGINYETVEVSFQKNTNVDQLEKINPLGVVPALVTDNGQVLTQNAAILEFIADQKPASKLLPAAGTLERAQAMSWLSFVASDFHKAFSPLFTAQMMSSTPQGQDEIRKFQKGMIDNYLQHLDRNLAGKSFLTGSQFTVADAYLFTVLGWCKWLEVDFGKYPNVKAFTRHCLERPAVRRVAEKHDMLSEY